MVCTYNSGASHHSTRKSQTRNLRFRGGKALLQILHLAPFFKRHFSRENSEFSNILTLILNLKLTAIVRAMTPESKVNIMYCD